MSAVQDLFSLDGQVALVTGGSSGLGARFAEVLASAGAKVVLTARRPEQLRAVAEELAGAVAIPCDITVPEERERLIQTVTERFGRIDVLVNNAGASHTLPAEQQSTESFASVLDLNLTSLFALSRLVGERMLAQGAGSIVNIASVYGLVASGSLPQAAYAASKGGVVSLTRELAAQWARRGVRVNAVCPGWFRSELTSEMLDTEAGANWIRRRTPMGRVGEPGELDGVLLFLASRAGSYVTGAAIPVDGGYVAI